MRRSGSTGFILCMGCHGLLYTGIDVRAIDIRPDCPRRELVLLTRHGDGKTTQQHHYCTCRGNMHGGKFCSIAYDAPASSLSWGFHGAHARLWAGAISPDHIHPQFAQRMQPAPFAKAHHLAGLAGGRIACHRASAGHPPDKFRPTNHRPIDQIARAQTQ